MDPNLLNTYDDEGITQNSIALGSVVLKHAQQAFFLVNAAGLVEPGYSQAVHELFHVSEANQILVWELFKLEEQSYEFQEWLKLVYACKSNSRFEKLAKLAPIKELTFYLPDGSKQLVALQYHLQFEPHLQHSKLLVIAEDVTEKRFMIHEVDRLHLESERQLKLIICLLDTPHFLLDSYFEYCNATLERVLNHLRLGTAVRSAQSSAFIEVLKDLNSIKADGNSFSFHVLSCIFAEMEDLLERIQRSEIVEEALCNHMQELAEAACNEMTEIILVKDILFRDQSRESVPVSRFMVRNLVTKAHELLVRKSLDPELTAFLRQCTQIHWPALGTLFSKYKKFVRELSGRMNKPTDLHIINPKEQFPHEVFKQLDVPFQHLISNALIHGIEPSRAEVEKPVISVEMLRYENYDEFVVCDNGPGINAEFIARAALERRIVGADTIVNMSNDDKKNLIFLPGLSTQKEVTFYSGRGLGLWAVQSALSEMGASVRLEKSKHNKGACFVIRVPHSIFPIHHNI
jgi:hypothetical protein